jgi:RHS repeat-associated protein
MLFILGGMLLPNRQGSVDSYRYGFNGKELDNELKGEGNSYDFGARMYDPRIMRSFSTNKLESKYPYVSPYVFTLNRPIDAKDPDGNEVYILYNKETKTLYIVDLDYYDKNLPNKKVNYKDFNEIIYKKF